MPHRTTTITTMLLLGAMLTGGSTTPGPTGAGVQESPTPPLGRGRERVYDYTVRVTVGDPTHVNGFNNLATRAMTCEATRLVFPMVLRGNYALVDPERIRVAGMIGGRWTTEGVSWTLRPPGPDGTAVVELTFPPLSTAYLGMEVRWRVRTWEPTIDEAGAAGIGWPEQWPPEVTPFLQPSRFIDSESSRVRAFVESVTNDRQREVPIYLAAKELTRQVVKHFRNVDGGRTNVDAVSSCEQSLELGRGSRADMTCLAVACLRAAGIPARPVMGLGTYLSKNLGKQVQTWLPWCEFYLPGAGWVAFDPFEMRGKGIEFKSLDAPWPWFGSERAFSERAAQSYELFVPGSTQPFECRFELTNGADPGLRGGAFATRFRRFRPWGWMAATCTYEACPVFLESITRNNRTGSLLDR